MDPDIEKKRKKRRRSARFYVNMNEPVNPGAAALIADFPPDDDDDQPMPTPAHTEAAARTRRMMKPDEVKRDIGEGERRELAGEGRAVVNPDGSVAYPVKTHQDAENALAHIRLGHGDVKEARRMLRRVARKEGWSDILDALGSKDGSAHKAAAGNPAPHPYGGSWTDRVSPPIGPGHASYSTGDHGAAAGTADPMNVPGPRALALGHPDMRQGTTNVLPLGTARTDFNAFPADLRGMANGVPVALSRLDAAAAAGMPGPPANPFARPADHIAATGRINTGPSHSLNCPTSAPPPAMKNSDRVELMKRFMFPGAGGAR